MDYKKKIQTLLCEMLHRVVENNSYVRFDKPITTQEKTIDAVANFHGRTYAVLSDGFFSSLFDSSVNIAEAAEIIRQIILNAPNEINKDKCFPEASLKDLADALNVMVRLSNFLRTTEYTAYMENTKILFLNLNDGIGTYGLKLTEGGNNEYDLKYEKKYNNLYINPTLRGITLQLVLLLLMDKYEGCNVILTDANGKPPYDPYDIPITAERVISRECFELPTW